MKKTRLRALWLCLLMPIVIMFSLAEAQAGVTLEHQYKVSDIGLFFNGVQTKGTSPNEHNPDVMDFAFGKTISAHGDAIKVHEEFIFTTWYKGGKNARNLMLSRYNTKTQVLKTIEFPHRHTGYVGKWWIGESHNTAAIGISPKDGKIHILYDMHSYNDVQFNNDYFRYSYSKKNAATVSDDEFTLSLFVADATNDYGHNNLNGMNNPAQYSDLTYPTFFLNENNDLLFFMRTGGNNNGGYVFTSYDSNLGIWADMTQFNYVNSSKQPDGPDYDWGLYGEMKYINGKLRTAFQTRSANNNDKYEYQNGIFYAYSDDQSGKSKWKNHKAQGFSIPFSNPESLKIYEPGDLVKTTKPNMVYIVGGFDFTVTDKGDVHIVSEVKDKEFNITKKMHSYKPAGSADFIHTTDYTGGANLYTYGDSVYIIGLKDGRPFVQKGKGGTNSFTTIYEDKTGRQFNHGVLNIHNGKIYYYLQDKGNTTKLPLYVQIIDLGLTQESAGPEGYSFVANEKDTVSVTGTMDVAYGADGLFSFLYSQRENVLCTNAVFGDPAPGAIKKCYVKSVPVLFVKLTAPINNAQFELEKPVTLATDASSDKNNITHVNFRVNGVFLKQDRDAPYSVEWTPSQAGSYNIDAVLFTDDVTTLISDKVSVTVKEAVSTSSSSFRSSSSLSSLSVSSTLSSAAVSASSVPQSSLPSSSLRSSSSLSSLSVSSTLSSAAVSASSVPQSSLPSSSLRSSSSLSSLSVSSTLSSAAVSASSVPGLSLSSSSFSSPSSLLSSSLIPQSSLPNSSMRSSSSLASSTISSIQTSSPSSSAGTSASLSASSAPTSTSGGGALGLLHLLLAVLVVLPMFVDRVGTKKAVSV